MNFAEFKARAEEFFPGARNFRDRTADGEGGAFYTCDLVLKPEMRTHEVRFRCVSKGSSMVWNGMVEPTPGAHEKMVQGVADGGQAVRLLASGLRDYFPSADELTAT